MMTESTSATGGHGSSGKIRGKIGTRRRRVGGNRARPLNTYDTCHTMTIAILDDYIGVALEYGDWTVLPDDAEITVYRHAIPPERLVDELSDYEIVVITQQ